MPNQLESRVKALEEWRNKQMIVQALSENNMKHMDERFDRVENAIKGITDNIKEITESKNKVGSRVLWIVGTAVISAFVMFVINGGLSIAPS
ncbi:hypothetical protein [Kiloniella litopenaei]|nr:hypothetical protein [Kiloniella litopenaei]